MWQIINKDTQKKIFQIVWYLIIFSIIGLIIETIYCYITTGVIESRKGLLWGPFCPVYGVGATILIFLLYRYKDNVVKLFLYGMVLGGIIEYLISYILEAMYGIRFWEYSYLYSNLNGRICLIYSIFWGLLAAVIIKYIKSIIDYIIKKIPYKNLVTIIILLFTFFNLIFTVWGINTYEKRAKNIYKSKNNKVINQIENNYFNNERMRKTFPNLRIITDEGKEVFVRDII